VNAQKGQRHLHRVVATALVSIDGVMRSAHRSPHAAVDASRSLSQAAVWLAAATRALKVRSTVEASAALGQAAGALSTAACRLARADGELASSARDLADSARALAIAARDFPSAARDVHAR
jgi:hypothetical protein